MSSIKDISWKSLASVHDDRGILTSVESNIDIPFEVRRIFYMHHVISERGGHAHTDTDQLVIAISGSFIIKLFDGINGVEFKMDDPEKGLFYTPDDLY